MGKSDKVTRAIKLEVVKPQTENWQDIGPKLRALQKVVARALNDCIRAHYLDAAPKVQEAQARGEKVSYKTIYEKNLTYPKFKEKYEHELGSASFAALCQTAQQRWNKDWFSVLVSGDVSLPSFKSNCPILVRADNVKILEQPNGDFTDRLIKLKFRRVQKGQVIEDVFVLSNRSFDSSRTAIWNRLQSGEYKLGNVQLNFSKRKHKWFVTIPYSFDAPPEIDDSETTVGVDMGISVPLCLAVYPGFERAMLREEGETIQAFRSQIRRRRAKLRSNERGILERRAGHGRSHKLAAMEKLENLVKDFRRTRNHALSLAVINFAKKHNAGRIVLEDLKGFREEKIQERIESDKKQGYFLEEWSTFELQTMIEQKAKVEGMKTVKIDPAYTSQRCSNCGHISPENRKTQEKFKCVSCGYPKQKDWINADYNAARNLATADIRRLIDENEYVKTRKKEKLKTTNTGSATEL